MIEVLVIVGVVALVLVVGIVLLGTVLTCFCHGPFDDVDTDRL